MTAVSCSSLPIARMTGGSYFRARDTEGLNAVYRLLDQIEPAADHSDIVRPTAELFFWPLSVSLAVAVAWVLGYLVLSFVPTGRLSARLEAWRAAELARLAETQRGG